MNQYHPKFTYPLPPHSILVEYRLKYFYNSDAHKYISQSVDQTIQKNDIIKEYKDIRDQIIKKYFWKKYFIIYIEIKFL